MSSELNPSQVLLQGDRHETARQFRLSPRRPFLYLVSRLSRLRPIRESVLLDAAESALSYSTHVAVDADGNLNIIWAEFDCQQVFPFTCTWHLFYTRSTDGGATFSTPQDVANQSPGDALFGPQIAIDPWGKINIAWEGDATGAGGTPGGASRDAVG